MIIINQLGKDEVPNVRFNAVKVAEQLRSKLDKSKMKNLFQNLFEKLSSDKDPDVSYFATTALGNL